MNEAYNFQVTYSETVNAESWESKLSSFLSRSKEKTDEIARTMCKEKGVGNPMRIEGKGDVSVAPIVEDSKKAYRFTIVVHYVAPLK